MADTLYYQGRDVEAIKELYASYSKLHQTLGDMVEELAKWQ